jgi:hypothetical protein
VDLIVLPRAGEPDFAAVQRSLAALGRDLARRLKVPPARPRPSAQDGAPA